MVPHVSMIRDGVSEGSPGLEYNGSPPKINPPVNRLTLL